MYYPILHTSILHKEKHMTHIPAKVKTAHFKRNRLFSMELVT